MMNLSKELAPVIAIYGPDGAGKTTSAHHLQKTLERSGFDCEIYQLGVYNGRTRFLKTLKDISNFILDSSNEESQKNSSNNMKTIGSRRSSFAALIHFIDVGFRTWQARAGSDIVIADRYVHDLLIYDNPGPLRRLFSWFEHPPFYPVILVGPSDVIAERSEYDEESITAMYDRLDGLNFKQIDATCSPEKTVAQIIKGLDETESFPINISSTSPTTRNP